MLLHNTNINVAIADLLNCSRSLYNLSGPKFPNAAASVRFPNRAQLGILSYYRMNFNTVGWSLNVFEDV